MHRKLFYLLLILLPIQLGRHFWPQISFVNGLRIDYLSPTLYLTDILVVVILGIWFFKHKSQVANLKITNKKTKQHYVYFLLAIFWLLLTSIFATIPALAFLKVATILKLAALAYYIVVEKPNIHISALCLTVASVYSSIIAWIQFTSGHSIGGAFWWAGERTFTITSPGIARAIIGNHLILRPYGTFPHPNVLAGFLVVTSPFAIFVLFQKNINSYIRIPILFFLMSSLIISLSRSAWFTMIVIAFIFSTLFLIKTQILKNIKHYINATFIIGVLTMFIVFAPIVYYRSISLFSIDTQTISQRAVLNNAGRSMIRNHIAIGIGMNNFIVNLPNYISIASYQDIQPAHNTYILIGAETGIIGLGIVLYGIGLVILKNRSDNKKNKTVRFAMLASLTGILLLSFFDHYFYTITQTQLLTAIVVGFILSTSMHDSAI